MSDCHSKTSSKVDRGDWSVNTIRFLSIYAAQKTQQVMP
jgi:hypothetical protein